jgi:hypothetical protein
MLELIWLIKRKRTYLSTDLAILIFILALGPSPRGSSGTQGGSAGRAVGGVGER